jgi:hypothetical protein
VDQLIALGALVTVSGAAKLAAATRQPGFDCPLEVRRVYLS